MKPIDLMIIGAQKAGTTALKNFLDEHPAILGHEQREFAFFQDDATFAKGYKSIFKADFVVGDSATAQVVMAKNAGLYNHEEGLKRLAEHNPDCKLVFLVREPVSRAWSAYNMEYFRGWLKQDFSELKGIIERNDREDLMHRLFIQLGEYADQVELIYKYFPKGQVMIRLFDDLKTQPEQLVQEILTWLNLDAEFVPDTQVEHNTTTQPKSALLRDAVLALQHPDNPIRKLAKRIIPSTMMSKLYHGITNLNKSSVRAPKIAPEMKIFLQEYYQPYNARLEQATGLDLSRWNKQSVAETLSEAPQNQDA